MRREDKVYFLIAFFLAGLCLFGDLNTRIGWLGRYSNQDTTVLAAFVMAWLFFGIALVMMVWSARLQA